MTRKHQITTPNSSKWIRDVKITLLNKPTIPTRIDPSSGKGSTLDLAIISTSLKTLVEGFKVDSKREWSLFTLELTKTGVKPHKYSDNLAL